MRFLFNVLQCVIVVCGPPFCPLPTACPLYQPLESQLTHVLHHVHTHRAAIGGFAAALNDSFRPAEEESITESRSPPLEFAARL